VLHLPILVGPPQHLLQGVAGTAVAFVVTEEGQQFSAQVPAGGLARVPPSPSELPNASSFASLWPSCVLVIAFRQGTPQAAPASEIGEPQVRSSSGPAVRVRNREHTFQHLTPHSPRAGEAIKTMSRG
jgi:hypothetical protein